MNLFLKKIVLFVFLSLNSLLFGQDKAVQSVTQYLNDNYQHIGVNQNDVLNWVITDNHSSPSGIKHFHIVQTLNGIEIQNGTANITLDANDSVVHIAHRLVANIYHLSNEGNSPLINESNAIKAAAKQLNIFGEAGKKIQINKANHFEFEKGTLSQEKISVDKKYWFDGKALKLVWVVSIYLLNDEHWWQIFIDAENGEELNRIDWVVSCSIHNHEFLESENKTNTNQSVYSALPPPGTDQYSVFPLPVESPNHGGISLEVGPYDQLASPYGWHDDNGVAGEEYTITRGNNVYAYEDAANLNLPGYSPDGGSGLNFNFPLDLNQNPVNYQDVAITNLFYTCNRIHDILYHYGFDEESGNFQTNNYGNGGYELDHVLAEAQDGAGFNNAYFATPNDGENPRMQMYLFRSNQTISDVLTVNSPSFISGSYAGNTALFGPGLPDAPITEDLVLVYDGVLPYHDGCEPLLNTAPPLLIGKIAVINRGGCSFVTKIENAQNAGAIAAIIINNVPDPPFLMNGIDTVITIPSIMISQADGAILTTQMANGNVNVTLAGAGNGTADRASDFDNGIIIHEYGHGLSNRLTGGADNSYCLGNAEQMGEGWSDFLAVMLTMDTTVSNPVYRPMGTYARFQPTSGTGIRNAPYDTSFVVNNYTYADVADVANVSEPHGIGFIWATMLWDLNWAFIDKYGFDSNVETGYGGNNKVLELVIEGLKLQPCSPGFVDGRDAILLADQLLNGGANACLIWRVFAKRGLGYSATQGSPQSRTDQAEAFDVPTPCKLPTSPPTAVFDANITQTCTGEVQFTDQSFDLLKYRIWDFGDSTTSFLQNPKHTYSEPGLYTVRLIAVNSLGSDTLTKVDFINVKTAEFNWDINKSTVSFNDMSSSGANWLWSFGDGSTSQEQNPTHTYTFPNVYEVSLQVDGACIAKHNIIIEDSLNSGGLQIAFFPNPTSNEIKLSINQALESDGTLQIYSADGKLVEEFTVGKGATELTLQLQHLAAQVYYFVFKHKNDVEVKKVMIQK